MQTNNLLGISDLLMVDKVHSEMPAGGPVTLAVYDQYSTFGFSRLRKSGKFSALSDLERQEAAYNAAEQFLTAILCGQYVPRDGLPSMAFYWTICKRRAFDFLRKIASAGPDKDNDSNEPHNSDARAFVRRTSLDDPDESLAPGETENITTWLDAQLIWEIARRKLSHQCYEIIVETVQKDRPHDEVAIEKGYALHSLKTLKSKCLSQLRQLLRNEL